MASVLWVASSCYCYSDTTYGVSPNAAMTGLTWSMNGVLPDYSQPWVEVDVMGLAYRYRMVKDPNTGVTVYVRNEDTNGGYIFEERDDWNAEGGVITKYFRFPYIPASRWGQGSIDVDGDGQVQDVVVTYNYRMEINEDLMLCQLTPLEDPSCPGFADALKDLLANMEEMNPDDPFYDEWVQANLSLNEEAERDDDEDVEREEPEEKEANFEKQLGGSNSIDQIIDAGQQDSIMAELAQVPKLDSYYIMQIPGGAYEESLELRDAELPDNRRALSNLSSDSTHRTMVRSQYDR